MSIPRRLSLTRTTFSIYVQPHVSVIFPCLSLSLFLGVLEVV